MKESGKLHAALPEGYNLWWPLDEECRSAPETGIEPRSCDVPACGLVATARFKGEHLRDDATGAGHGLQRKSRSLGNSSED
jgi:hypothetical protein